MRNATCVGTETSKVPTRVTLLFIFYSVTGVKIACYKNRRKKTPAKNRRKNSIQKSAKSMKLKKEWEKRGGGGKAQKRTLTKRRWNSSFPGYVESRVVYYLMNTHVQRRCIYLTRVGS